MIDIDKAKELWPPTCHGRWMSEEYEPGLVSVIIPTYNRAQLVTEAMDSVFAQSYRPIELIVVDDGSTDNTAEVIEEWRKQHSGDPQFALRYFRQENRGAPAARNLGLIESKGEFIQFLDSDDLLKSEMLLKGIDIIKANNADFAVFGAEKFEGKKENIFLTMMYSKYDHNLYTHIVSNHVFRNGSQLVHRRAAYIAGPWDQELKVWQDTEYQARFLAGEFNGKWVPEIGLMVRNTSGSISKNNILNVWASMMRACLHIEKMAISNGKLNKELSDAIGRRLATVARKLKKAGSPDAVIVMREALKRLSFRNRIKNRLYWAIPSPLIRMSRIK